MAKDPAVLFYTSDFLSGTITMSYEQKGKYITLLCIQHNQGYLLKEDIDEILAEKDIKVRDKFTLYADGKYYNTKLKEEAERRAKFTESRRNNRVNGHKDKLRKSYDTLMETGTGTETGTRTSNLKLETRTETLSSIASEMMKKRPNKSALDELDKLTTN